MHHAVLNSDIADVANNKTRWLRSPPYFLLSSVSSTMAEPQNCEFDLTEILTRNVGRCMTLACLVSIGDKQQRLIAMEG